MKAPTTRYHKMLFDRDFPFQGKKVESKVQYKRKNKHRRRDHEIS